MEQSDWCKFVDFCGGLEKKQLADLLELLLTAAEKEDVMARFMIVQELLAGELPHREIAKKLNLSIAKISRGSNAVKAAKGNSAELLELINKSRQA